MNEQNTADQKQSIEELTDRYSELNEKRVTAKANAETAETRLEELKQQARKEYDTDDVDELREKLKKMEADNERKRAEYQTSLDSIEESLQKVESTYGSVDADGGSEISADSNVEGA
jgi:chromosome segregation ATPase